MAMNTDTAVQLYVELFGNIRVGLCIVQADPAQPELSPRVVDVNQAARRISAQLEGDAGSRRLDRCFPGLFGADLARVVRKLELFGDTVDLGEREVAENFYRIQVFSVFDGYFGILFTDTTERKRAEAEIAQLLAKVQRNAADLEQRVAERTAQLEEINTELDSFAYSVSHDLRAPLRSMKGFAEALLHDATLNEKERAEYLMRILATAQGMERLIQDLLAYSRLSRQEIRLHSVSLDRVVREAAQQLQLVSGGSRYELEVAPDLPEVQGHHAVLVQAVLNLFSNGIKFVPAGRLPRLTVWCEERGDSVRLFVKDNGIGIAPQHQERIFNIFERLHGIDEYPGSGIGLAIVRKAVVRMEGRIGVESTPGEGSRFWIELRKAVQIGER